MALSLNAASSGNTALLTPQGTSAGTAVGDYVSDTNALNTAYHYFVEVPPGLTTLTVDLFDPDIGLGGANEDTAGRDRDRGGAYNSTAGYSIFKPNGTARTASFATGTVAAPAGSDNAWTTLFTTTPDTVRDNFAAAAYTNNNGVVNWTTNWAESNDDNNAGAGLIQITGGELRIQDNGNAAPSTIEREADTSTYGTATLTFTMRTANVSANDVMLLQASSNGGGAWTTVATYTGAFASTNQSYDISAFKATNTRIRFIESANYNGTDQFFVDNVQIADNQITPGHWEVRVDMSSAVDATADDINALGLRAHDGTSGAGGTELNMYVDGIVAYGVNPPNAGTTTRTYQFYPWVSSGCSCLENDFDYDSNEGNTGSMTFTARAGGTFTQSIASTGLSGENAWNRDTITGFTTDQASINYGIWDWDASITSYVNGNGQNGNYTTTYLATSTAAANPPTANPPANSFRIYFPTDAGAAPAKPYIEQLLTSRGAGLLQVGVPHRYTVTVRVENPTSRAITFSSPTNIVTANVPGGGAVYGGNAQVGQGSILSQPAVGGTGNITWNPGSVAAGATTIMSYDLTVTAASAGQRILVTGAATGANGTRALYVDETGNTTQARATNQVGPICELAVTEGLVTDVMIASFEAAVKQNKTTIEWTTASENGTIGFNVYRVDAARNGALTPVNDRPLPANVGAPQGGTYRLVDKSNSSTNTSYVLEELTASGKKNRYGPFPATTARRNIDIPWNGASDRQPRHGSTTSVSIPVNGSPKKLTSVAVMAGVNKTGVVRVAASDVASMLNLPLQPLLAAIQNRTIAVTNNGKPVAWNPTAANDAILFYGEKGDTLFSNDRVYRIELGAATPMSVVQVAPSAAPIATFNTTRDLETDSFAATVLPLDPNSDYWFWDYVLSGDATDGRRTFTVNVPSVASAGNATLQVRLQGAQASTPHRARVSLNGAPIGEVTWTSLDGKTADLSIPGGLLRDGSNDIGVEGVLEPGSTFDVFYIDGFNVGYQRKAVPEGNALALTPPADRQVTAGPFATLPLVLDTTNPLQPRVLQNGAYANGNISFVAPAGVQSMFISERSAFIAPSFLRGSEPASLVSNRTGADYVVITPAALRDGAQQLANLRNSDGLQTLVVDLDQIYDELNGGNPNPSAIRSFIAITSRWSRRPKYFVLIGGGTVDYRGLQDSPGLMPPMMFRTSDGLYASDSLYADRTLDNIPDVALGRIPVSNADELNAYLQKLSAAARANTAASKIVWSADAVDRGASFRDASLKAEAPLAGRPATR
ncbi:MAG TPA: C25 family cysteine peptidase, partial [Thermoanaerobaculia bacterium]|nr:C25 family cysteine peptidase [Thermoanaerobaculia bacterium]